MNVRFRTIGPPVGAELIAPKRWRAAPLRY
jgi:hypothetical protein